MQKNKNTTFSSKTVFANFLFIFLCLVGATYSFYLFFKSFNQSLFKNNEKPIATITFKYKTAQRKFIDRVIWDRLKQDSPVYNGDIIRTAPQSEATIYFSDGNIMSLYENTMAQIYILDSGLNLDLSDGSVSLEASDSSNGITLNSNGNVLTLDAGTKLNAEQSSDNNSLKVLVQEGNASLSSLDEQDSKTVNIQSGSALLLDKNGSGQQIISAQIIYPLPNAKILYHDSSEYDVSFSWQKQNFTQDTQVLLQVSSTKNFDKPFFSKTFNEETQVSIKLPNGTWYYKISPVLQKNNQSTEQNTQDIKLLGSEGKFSLMYAPSPALMAPQEKSSYSYKNKKPSIRFVWQDNEYASSYQLEISDNQDFNKPIVKQRTSSSSSIISQLGEGTWYWRVTPFYAINNVGLASPSKIQSFTITKTVELEKPKLLLPQNNSNIDISNNKNVSFSWKKQSEAASYQLKISRNKDLSSVIIQKNISQNYLDLNPSVENLTEGVYYWALTQTDSMGNVSQLSDIRTFIASKGQLYQRTVFPPNNYKISEGRVVDTSFTWKTNLPYDSRFQVATDANFKNLVIDQKTNITSVTLKELKQGEYYWRIKADTNEFNYVSQTKKFTIIPLLEMPISISPKHNSRVVIRPNTPFEFSWNKVKEAEYYSVKIYSLSNGESIYYERNFIEQPSFTLDMENTKDGLYRLVIQAFASETELSSRRHSYLGEYTFTLKHLTPVKLVKPVNNTKIDGVQSIKNPGTATWSSVETTKNTVFYLSKNKNPTVKPIMAINNPSKTVRLNRLEPGTYYWTVKASTLDDFDISATQVNKIEVTPIPPLKNASLQEPKDKTVFDKDYILNNQKITFNWTKVPDAQSYRIIIKNRNKVFVDKIVNKTSFTIDDISTLDRGKFTWSIEALNYYENVIFQRSKVQTSDFTIDLPEIKKQQIKIDGVLYGK